ncbi:unnamed protein product [Ranitomeya imitator]|uniref:RNA 2',3'-cyclic phosphodiesterase n=1 Tax=Ranitomeya imitator TaxID=111125 RepID=A0ABN9M3A7_9NEOB|nr:unnamed protein product [Ranitomeya imitator]
MPEMRRLFFALDLPSTLQQEIIHWRAKAFPQPEGHPVIAANLHLTLAFLGDVSIEKQRVLASLASRIISSLISAYKFDDAGQWLRSQKLANLLRSQAARNGCYQSPLPFHPHITLYHNALHPVALPTPGFKLHYAAQHFSLYESRFIKGKRTYQQNLNNGRLPHARKTNMQFSPALQQATLIQRYKRFLADVITSRGETITISLPEYRCNDGLCHTRKFKEKIPTHLGINPNKRRGKMICVNTLRANMLVKEYLSQTQPETFDGYNKIRSEVKYGIENSRIDFMLQADDKPNCYIETKSVTLSEQGKGYFPDACKNGERAVLLFAVLHSGIMSVSPAEHIDKKYAQFLNEAKNCGVEIIALKAEISAMRAILSTPVPSIL